MMLDADSPWPGPTTSRPHVMPMSFHMATSPGALAQPLAPIICVIMRAPEDRRAHDYADDRCQRLGKRAWRCRHVEGHGHYVGTRRCRSWPGRVGIEHHGRRQDFADLH